MKEITRMCLKFPHWHLKKFLIIWCDHLFCIVHILVLSSALFYLYLFRKTMWVKSDRQHVPACLKTNCCVEFWPQQFNSDRENLLAQVWWPSEPCREEGVWSWLHLAHAIASRFAMRLQTNYELTFPLFLFYNPYHCWQGSFILAL